MMNHRLLSLLPLLLFAAGCQEFPQLESPTAQVRSMNVRDVNANGITMDFAVAVANPNKYELPVSGADYKIDMAGVTVVNDTATPPATAIPAQGSGNITMPVHLKFDDLLKAKDALVASKGDVPYNLQGGVNFTPGGYTAILGKRAVEVPVKYSGVLHLRQILQDNLNAVAKSAAAQELLAQFVSGGIGGYFGR